MIFDNLNRILSRIRLAQERSGRRSPVEVVAVTKYASSEAVVELLSLGLVGMLGESRVQDAQRRISELGRPLAGGRPVEWRMLGHLQTNKAKQAVGLFDWLDSLDSLRLASALDRALADSGRFCPVLIQVKLLQSEAQSGVSPQDLPGLLQDLKRFPRLEPRGLMGIAPLLEPVEAVRPYFRTVRALFEKHCDAGNDFLSLGMSRDYEIAVEEGANLLRIGTAIFGRKPDAAS